MIDHGMVEGQGDRPAEPAQRHDGGVVEAAGVYLMGIPFLRRRKSSLIDGAGDDARDLSTHLAAYLDSSST